MSVVVWAITFLAYIGYGWLSFKNNNGELALWLWLAGLYPGWLFLSRYSKNLLFDGAVYDLMMSSGFLVGVAIFTTHKLNATNYLGVAIVILGLACLKA